MQSKALEQVLADFRGDAQVMRKRGLKREASMLEQWADEVQLAAHEYLEWLPEEDAMLRSGHSRQWLRGRFVEWERQGHAKSERSERWYRTLIVPRRLRDVAAFEAGKAVVV